MIPRTKLVLVELSKSLPPGPPFFHESSVSKKRCAETHKNSLHYPCAIHAHVMWIALQKVAENLTKWTLRAYVLLTSKSMRSRRICLMKTPPFLLSYPSQRTGNKNNNIATAA